MRKTLFLFTFSFTCQVLFAQFVPEVYAHRGCWLGSDVPENSIKAVEMAKRYGYTTIECDVHYTKDSVMVIMHDTWNMQRCLRLRVDNSPLPQPLALKDITFADLRANYVLASDHPAYREPVPTLEELLQACYTHGIVPLLHSDLPAAYAMAERLFHGKWIAFSGNDQLLQQTRQYSDCMILLHMDNVTADEAIARLKRIGGRCGMSTMDYKLQTADFCHALREAGFEIQSSIFPTPHDLRSTRNGATIALSDFSYMPNKQQRPSKTVTIRRQTLDAGTTLQREDTYREYGATVVKLTFQGEIELTVNGNRTYTLQRNTMGTDIVGARLYKGKPMMSIRAKTTTRLRKAMMMTYQF